MSSPTQAVEDYLKAIHALDGADKIVTPVEIVNRLGVRAPSVTGMLKRLAESGFVEYHPHKGARLTELGVTEARRVIRRHRLVELFLTKVLGLDWSEVDKEAEALEHAISPRLEQAIADYLGEPGEDPHGHVIPTSDGVMQRRSLRPLSVFEAGQRVVIREVGDESPERLRRWQDLGLKPGVEVEFVTSRPLDGVFELRIGEAVVPLGKEALEGLLGEEVSRSP